MHPNRNSGQRPRQLTALPAAALAVLLAGCSGEPVGYVSGKVTLNDRPVTEGSVVFENAEAGISVSVPLQSDGSYEVRTYDRKGLPPGSYKVAVTPATMGEGKTPLAVDPSQTAAAPPSIIPPQYHSTATSDLTATVKQGDNPPIDFDLKP
jgi:hypothetical protein